MKDYIKVVIPHLHVELAHAQVLSQIERLAQALPPSPIAGFEFRLGDSQPQVDFQIGLSHTTALSWVKTFSTYQVSDSYRNFILDWIDSTSILYQYIPHLFLEFDLLEEFSQLPIPCVFLCLAREASGDVQNLIELVLSKFCYSVNPSLKSNLSLCLQALPDSAKIAYLGVMMSRPSTPVRLVVEGISAQELLSYVAQITRAEQSDVLEFIVSSIFEFVDSIYLSFDIGENISPRVGLECFLLKQPCNKSRWFLLLNYLIEMSLCTPAKRNALLAWSGFSQKADAPEIWPSNLTGGDLLLSSSALSVFWREISHIKIVYDLAEEHLLAKGYLSFGHCWLDLDGLTKN